MRGLELTRNNNGFFVARVHYTADENKDPARDGAEWYKKARKGMPEASWRKEYEIDWFARSGQLVYPIFSRHIHVIDPFEIPYTWTRYMAIDPGLRNPTAALWAAIDKEDNVFIYDEYYVREKVIKEHCEAIKRKEKESDIVRITRLIDPSSTGRSMINKRTNREEYARYGIYCRPAINDLEVGINRVTFYLTPDVGGHPSLYFFSTLKNTIKEISGYRWQQIDNEAATRKDPPEKPQKKCDHLMDCLRYILMDDPHYLPIRKRRVSYEPHYQSGDYNTGY